MTLPPELHRELAALAIAALGHDDLDRIQRRITTLAARVPGSTDALMLEVRGSTLEPVAAAGPGLPDPASPAVVDRLVELPAGTGLVDIGLVAHGDDHEVVAVGEEDGRRVVLVVVGDDQLTSEHEGLAVLADLAQVAAAATARRAMEDELRRSEDRLTEAQRLGQLGSYDWHIASDTNVWSDELYRIYGTEPQSFNASYERFLEFIHPDDREKVKAVHAEAYQRGGTYEMEERIVRPDGEERILFTTGEVVLGADGTPERMRGVCLDVTEQREHQRRVTDMAVALHDAATRRKQALEINDGVVQGLASVIYTLEAGNPSLALDAARRTLTAARSMMHDMMEPSAETEQGSLVRESAPVSVLGGRAQPVAAAPASSGAARVLVVDDADDLRMLLKISVSSREGFEVVGEACDGAEAIELAEELRPDVVLLDLAMPVMDGFEALPRIRALLPEAAIVVLSGFDADRMERRAVELGADRYVEKGTSSAKLLAILDELVDLPSPAAEPLVDPMQPDPEHELPLHHLSHELRTPLTVIRSMIDTLHDQMDALPAAAVREILAAAARNADAMRELLDSVASLQRLSTGELVVAVQPLDVGALVPEIVSDLRGVTARHEVVVDAQAVVANVDPLRVRQVLTNLLSNAAKFSEAGAPIGVTVRQAGEHVTVRVVDRGPGVPPEHEHELFGRFAQFGNRGSGMGLGLYISRAIARAHGGDLRHERPADGGAAFVLELPVRADDREPAR